MKKFNKLWMKISEFGIDCKKIDDVSNIILMTYTTNKHDEETMLGYIRWIERPRSIIICMNNEIDDIDGQMRKRNPKKQSNTLGKNEYRSWDDLGESEGQDRILQYQRRIFLFRN